MKHSFTLLALAGILCFTGCASDGPSGEEIQEQLGRGIRGEGTVSPDIDRTGDPYVKSREGSGLSPE